MKFTVPRRMVMYSSGRAIDRAEWQLHLERAEMSEFIPLWEVRTLVTDALQVVNDVDDATGMACRLTAHQASSAFRAQEP
jgi:hypothetical protein